MIRGGTADIVYACADAVVCLGTMAADDVEAQ